jgi:hypothetical protein
MIKRQFKSKILVPVGVTLVRAGDSLFVKLEPRNISSSVLAVLNVVSLIFNKVKRDYILSILRLTSVELIKEELRERLDSIILVAAYL